MNCVAAVDGSWVRANATTRGVEYSSMAPSNRMNRTPLTLLAELMTGNDMAAS